jgi:hypothetical protein
MFRAIYIALLTITYFVPHHARAQLDEIKNIPSPRAAPSPEVQQAFGRAMEGHVGEAIESMRLLAKDSAANSYFLGLLLYSWRRQFIINGIDPTPPVVWEMDWLRCSALQGTTGGIAEPVAILAEYYGSEYFQAKDASGKMLPIPGPGRSPELARCWSSVNEGTSSAKDCIANELAWREARKLPVFACPPTEPTKASAAKFPEIRLE